jgi:hypothetical protein
MRDRVSDHGNLDGSSKTAVDVAPVAIVGTEESGAPVLDPAERANVHRESSCRCGLRQCVAVHKDGAVQRLHVVDGIDVLVDPDAVVAVSAEISTRSSMPRDAHSSRSRSNASRALSRKRVRRPHSPYGEFAGAGTSETTRSFSIG